MGIASVSDGASLGGGWTSGVGVDIGSDANANLRLACGHESALTDGLLNRVWKSGHAHSDAPTEPPSNSRGSQQAGCFF